VTKWVLPSTPWSNDSEPGKSNNSEEDNSGSQSCRDKEEKFEFGLSQEILQVLERSYGLEKDENA